MNKYLRRICRTLKSVAIGDPARAAAAPNMPSGRELLRYQFAALLAAVPSVALATYYFGPRVLLMIAVAFAAAAAVDVLFAVVRKRPAGAPALSLAVLLALILPPEIPLWMAAAGAAFGAFFGEQVFGGNGHHIFNPVLLGKGFLLFSFPQVVSGSYFGSMLGHPSPEAWIICSAAVGLGAIAMILARPGNAQILAGLFIPAAALAWSLQLTRGLEGLAAVRLLAGNGFLFGACFLACDPAGSPRRHLGRWMYGALVGSAAIVMQSFSDYGEAMMTAILVGNLCTPTIDIITGRPSRVEAVQ
ncbi:MAG: RnfABCDGE type electron transport complex subunit D [Planctomycetota bacterium]